MKRGQTTVEFLLLMLIILSFSLYVFQFYFTETNKSISLAVTRMDVDEEMANSKFEGTLAYLNNIIIDDDKSQMNVSITNINGAITIDSNRILYDMGNVSKIPYLVQVKIV